MRAVNLRAEPRGEEITGGQWWSLGWSLFIANVTRSTMYAGAVARYAF